MKRIRLLHLLSVMVLPFTNAAADIIRDPIGVNVSAASPMSLTVRFADNQGTSFTTQEAEFCYRLLANGRCDPTALLGRLPAGRDLGSTQVPTSRITDVMTIPYSVIRSAVVRAQQVDYSDFFYVRRFTPVNGGDLGAGPGIDVFARVTCHLAGPATVPLSLTRVSVHGLEAEKEHPVKLIRLSSENIHAGRVEATVQHTGTGILEGWWEVRQPGDPELQSIDLLPQAALPPQQRAQQQRYRRVQPFRVTTTAIGKITIPGPDYNDLPRSSAGRHEILLRFAATQGRENRARLDVEGEPLNLFSGGVAGFAIPILEYVTPASLLNEGAVGLLSSRLVADQDDSGRRVWRLAWVPQQQTGLVLEFVATVGGRDYKTLTPANTGLLDFPSIWRQRLPQANMHVVLRDSNGQALSDPQRVFQ